MEPPQTRSQKRKRAQGIMAQREGKVHANQGRPEPPDEGVQRKSRRKQKAAKREQARPDVEVGTSAPRRTAQGYRGYSSDRQSSVSISFFGQGWD